MNMITEKIQLDQNDDPSEMASACAEIKPDEVATNKCVDSVNEASEDMSSKDSYLLIDNVSVSSDDLVSDFEPVLQSCSVRDNNLESNNDCKDLEMTEKSSTSKAPNDFQTKFPSRSKWLEIEPDSDEEFDPINEIVKCSRMNSADSTTRCEPISKCHSDNETGDVNEKSTPSDTTLLAISTDNNCSEVACMAPVGETKNSDVISADSAAQDNAINTEVIGKNGIEKLVVEKEDDKGSTSDENDKRDVDSKDDDEEAEGDDSSQETKGSKMKEVKRKLAVKKLSSLVEKLNKKIQHLEEQELTLDDMESDSVYTQLELYKKKFVLVWKKLCELTSQSPSMGRETEKPFVFKGTNYPQINKAIARFVNRYQAFPDFQDINDIVSTCNEFFKLKLNKQMMSSISTSAFTSVGKSLKGRRIRDYKENFGSHLTDQLGSERDPAMDDPELRKKLEDNKKKADSNMEKAFHHFESLPAKDCDESDDSDDDSDDDEEDRNESPKEKDGKDGLGAKIDEDNHVELISSEEEKSLRRPEKVEINSANSSSDSFSEVSCSRGSRGSTMKKSLSTQYDHKKPDVRSKKKSTESPLESEDSGISRNNSRGSSRGKESKSASTDKGSRRRPSSESTRSLRSNSSSLTPALLESSRSSKRKAESASGSKSPKKQRITGEPRPVFVRLTDEIRMHAAAEVAASTKMELGEGHDMLRHITKALTPSKVVLRNCMSCKVVCQKSCLVNSLRPAQKTISKQEASKSCKEKPSIEGCKLSKATSEVRISAQTSASVSGTESQRNFNRTIKKQSVGEETGPNLGNPATAQSCATGSGKQSTFSPDKAKCVDLSDSEDSNVGCSKDQKENDEGSVCSIFGKVVGEVLTFEECGDDNANKEEEGLVKTVASLGKELHSNADNNKPPNIPSPQAPSDVVDLEEQDSKNEDGIIFVGAYKTSSALTNPNIPSTSMDLCHTSKESSAPSVAQRSKSRPGRGSTDLPVSMSPYTPMSKMLVLAQRTKRKSDALVSTSGDFLNSGTSPRAPVPVPSSSDLMSKLLDPSFPTANVRVPKLPAKVMRQINNMTKKITATGQCKTKAFRGGSPKFPSSRMTFSAGTAYATATAKALQRRAYLEELYQHCVPAPDGTVKKKMARSLMRGNLQGVPVPPRNRSYALEDRLSETVVIDDDDSVGTPIHAQSHAADISRPRCGHPSRKAEPPRKKSRIVVPPPCESESTGNGTFATLSASTNTTTSQQRKFQQKTRSSDSDVILCGIEFDGETFPPLESLGNPEKAQEASTSMGSREPMGIGQTDEVIIPTEDVSAVSSAESRQWSRVEEASPSVQSQKNGMPCPSETRGLRAKTMSSDSDVILCEDTEDGVLGGDRLDSLVQNSLGRLVSKPLPMNEMSEMGPVSDSKREGHESSRNDNDAIVLD